MTLDTSSAGRATSSARRVSSADLAKKAAPPRKADKTEKLLTRQVSSEALPHMSRKAKSAVPPFPNPLLEPAMREQHTKALQLEAELFPMRLILSRLIAHPTLNRKGIFNEPVDPEKLDLADYFRVIEKPMDLGTIKARLYSVAYNSCKEVVDDIRLVFDNAMAYNPPSNAVHVFAKELAAFLEDQLEAFVPQLSLKHSKMETPKAVRVVSADVPAYTPHTATRHTKNADTLLGPSVMGTVRKRKKRGSKVNPNHDCQWCEGRTCVVCHQGCLHHEPPLLICNGANCAGAKVRKGATYYVAPDGSRQYCQRCYAGLPAVLSPTSQAEACRYKRDLLKRKNDEEVVEQWVTCSTCGDGMHQICAMYDKYAHAEESFVCLSCTDAKHARMPPPSDAEPYTFVSGSVEAVPLSSLRGDVNADGERYVEARNLPENGVSKFIEAKIVDLLAASPNPNADKTISVRMLSDCDRYFMVPDVVRKHFRMQAESDSKVIKPPRRVNYKSKAIALFQRIDGFDVCIFCMYVQEYDGVDEYDEEDATSTRGQKRVYIAYLDSVEHFRPRPMRTKVYHEMLVAYLASARKRGYETAHIWACPPSRGNSFIFWNHPASQRTPTRDRLITWYHGALGRAVDCGVVTDVRSQYESDFQRYTEAPATDASTVSGLGNLVEGKILCPPLLDGDFWIEEAVRIHNINITRYLKSRVADSESHSMSLAQDEDDETCPARLLATMLRDKVISRPSTAPFRRPVNAAALKLKDYHTVIRKPMDLGTVYSRCLLGEYVTLSEFVEDVQLVFSNAKHYNPEGHLIHSQAEDAESAFYQSLCSLVDSWASAFGTVVDSTRGSQRWSALGSISLSLDGRLPAALRPTGVVLPPIDVVEPHDDDKASTVSTEEERSVSTEYPPPKDVDLITGGADAVMYRMIGNDTWLLEKIGPNSSKKAGTKRKYAWEDELPSLKRRRQSWLAEEVGAAVRRLRTSFFTCSLKPSPDMTEPELEKVKTFAHYASSFHDANEYMLTRIADARHALLEFSQFRKLEFDTLRRAKHSTAILLYHLYHPGAPGLVPMCTSCESPIEDVRWHKTGRVVERRRTSRCLPPGLAGLRHVPKFVYEELCSGCYAKSNSKEDFIPLQASFPVDLVCP